MFFYEEYLQKLLSLQGEEFGNKDGIFNPNGWVSTKVKTNGDFKAIFGDTVVFGLTEGDKKKLSEISEKLHNSNKSCFSEPILPETFHMTLHDLSNHENHHLAKEQMAGNKEKVEEIFLCISKEFENNSVLMKSTGVYNFLDMSFVLGLVPIDEVNYKKLIYLYEKFQSVVYLDRILRPHITLTYFRNSPIVEVDVKKIKDMLDSLNKDEFIIELDFKKLCYQHFTSMNDFITVYPNN